MNNKAEYIALVTLRASRRKRDLLVRRIGKKNMHKDYAIQRIGAADDVVQNHLREFKKLIKKPVISF